MNKKITTILVHGHLLEDALSLIYSSIEKRKMKYIRKEKPVDAVQWFKNGDHPDDYKGGGYKLNAFGTPTFIPPEECKKRGDEGRVVYRCTYSGICQLCNKPLTDHGMIAFDSNVTTYIVCPGWWIVTEPNGNRYACTPEYFEANFCKND